MSKAKFLLNEIAGVQTFMDQRALRDYDTTFATLLLDAWATVTFRLSYGQQTLNRTCFCPYFNELVT